MTGRDTLDKDEIIFLSGEASQYVRMGQVNGGPNEQTASFVANRWHVFMLNMYGIAGTINIRDSNAKFSHQVTPSVGVWTKYPFTHFGTAGRLGLWGATNPNEYNLDDVSIILLDDVSLTVAAASKTNSTENGGVRADGHDTLRSSDLGLSQIAGRARFGYNPRHSAENALLFGNDPAYIANFHVNDDNYIRIYWSQADEVTLEYNAGGAGEHSGVWDALGEVDANVNYEIQIEYSAIAMAFSIDGVEKILINEVVEFDEGAAIAFMGMNHLSEQQGDAVFSAPNIV